METISDLNPSTGECLAEINCAGPAEVNAAVARARAAWPAWRGLSIEERCTLLARGAERLGEQAAELGELIAREMGKPRQDGLGEVRAYAAHVPKELEEVRALLAEIGPLALTWHSREPRALLRRFPTICAIQLDLLDAAAIPAAVGAAAEALGAWTP